MAKRGCPRSCSRAARRCAVAKRICANKSSGSPTPTSGRSSRSMSMSGGAAIWSGACRPWPGKRRCCVTTRRASRSSPVQRGLAEADFERRRQLVMLLVDRVVVTDADVEIRYVLPITPESEHVRFCQLRKDYFNDPAQLVPSDDL